MITELSTDSFHQFMAEHRLVACLLHHSDVAADAQLRQLGSHDDESALTWARIDVDEAPDIGKMFGVASEQSCLLVMRERVVLYLGPLSADAPDKTRAILDGAAQLDMAEVRKQIAEDRQGRDALFNRRACPTTWRTRQRPCGPQ